MVIVEEERKQYQCVVEHFQLLKKGWFPLVFSRCHVSSWCWWNEVVKFKNSILWQIWQYCVNFILHVKPNLPDSLHPSRWQISLLDVSLNFRPMQLPRVCTVRFKFYSERSLIYLTLPSFHLNVCFHLISGGLTCSSSSHHANSRMFFLGGF